ncbi:MULTISPECIES: acyl-CoA dehydratase activase [Oscillospiraceae]|uniref:2-hydroxyacyl-CoA dehydratase n=1 Tax=Oscillibacter valericigenes TaxID=351091 RepID=A0ABS2FQY8_9FIRM|nr:acyl-CoA dehydratase activase [Oscillibacter valericigenes]MBM6850014.1 2-hydroxyacyl-CoA dehydratase [Oscillibacter valericigenes]HJB77285.1 2-hydroxyacyl-CoA dehydratase [Candidatus Oscillibacter avistercoris]
MKVGLDVGSTTIKCVVLDDTDNLIYSTYERHYSHILEKSEELLRRVAERYGRTADLAISGSAGMGMAESVGVPFVQEVFATRVAANRLAPGTDCIIELGGEDAKILFLTGGMEVRMNGSCAGGTGAFIDQMATLLKMSADEMDAAAQRAEKTYTIASRCGVFAKSDIQPLINQGARAEDISASIYQAVVNQTIAGLAQGRPIHGNVLYLGGPLTFSRCLRESFDHTLGVKGACPENSLLFVALGAAFYSDQAFDLDRVADDLQKHGAAETYRSQPPLFTSREEYEAFRARHAKAAVPRVPFGADYAAPVHIGIDSGSTTVKVVVIDQEARILFTDYQPNLGNPVPLIREVLQKLYDEHPALHVASVTTTGYGEDLAKNAFHADYGVVETVAHFTAARHFLPNVDFIIDIGGQDMKCFKIEDGAISNIFLNEACSSGCGSFLQTFAQALGYDVKEFARLGLFAERPVDLGSRCTVFMNSSVKQAQKDGATIENISAGLSISVVKNAIYKVIRASSPEELGRNIVVQGGTFYNEAVLRAFEKEMGVEVIRPDIAGLMGAYGAALFGRGKARADQISTLLDRQGLADFRQETESRVCGLCGNNCQLTINTFADGATFISGNRCDRPVTGKADTGERNLYAYKRKLILGYKPVPGKRGKIGLPLCLNMWELLPFWHAFFTKLGFAVYHSPLSSRDLYLKGQGTIPSDTACFPAKLAHGHIQFLSKLGLDAIFYPCMTYNIDEGLGDNHYNCPVVAYYPEVIAGNCPEIQDTRFIYDYVGLHRPKDFTKKIFTILRNYFPDITKGEVKEATDAAYAEYAHHMSLIRREGERIMDQARAEGRRIIVLAGRPYHVDPEVNHGIDTLITRSGAAVITEDSISNRVEKFPTTVLNQWTYHARLYAAARYCCTQKDMDLVQLVSFGCGVDAITSDETREILQAGGKLYTQLKIDEITNLGAVRIRLRSLFAALDEQDEARETARKEA